VSTFRRYCYSHDGVEHRVRLSSLDVANQGPTGFCPIRQIHLGHLKGKSQPSYVAAESGPHAAFGSSKGLGFRQLLRESFRSRGGIKKMSRRIPHSILSRLGHSGYMPETRIKDSLLFGRKQKKRGEDSESTRPPSAPPFLVSRIQASTDGLMMAT